MKAQFIKYSVLLGLTLFAAGCTTVPGKTAATPQLQRDVTQMVMLADMAADLQCSSRKIVNTEIIEVQPEGQSGAERWTVERCGKIVHYRVTFTPSQRGGTNFGVQFEK